MAVINAPTESASEASVGHFRGATSSIVVGATSAHTILSLENPVGSGRRIYIKRAWANHNAASAPTVAFLLRFGRTTGMPSGGTIETAQKMFMTSNSPVGIVRRSPVATPAPGNLWVCVGVAAGTTPNQFPQAVDPAAGSADLVLLAGEAVVFTADANGASGRFWSVFSWQESIV